jgi:hypothetical protein
MIDDTETRWHVGKEIPILGLVAIAIQTATFVWWAGGQSERLGQLERQFEVQRVRVEAIDLSRAGMDGRVIRLEEQTRQVYEATRRIEAKIDAAFPFRRGDVSQP